MTEFFLMLAMNVAVYGGIGYLIGVAVRRSRPEFRPATASIGCLSVALILPLLLGIGAWFAALLDGPFSLPAREEHFFDFSDAIEIADVDGNVYIPHRFVDEVYGGKDAFMWSSYDDLVIVELKIANMSDGPIEIKRGDVNLTFDNVPVGERAISPEAAQAHLRSYEDVVLGVGGQFNTMPWEPLCGFPLLLAVAPRDWVWVENWKQAMIVNALDYGVIEPSESRHGFLYFNTRGPSDVLNAFGSNNQDRWGFQLSMTDEFGQVYEHSFDVEG